MIVTYGMFYRLKFAYHIQSLYVSDYFYENDKEFGRESQCIHLYGSESDSDSSHGGSHDRDRGNTRSRTFFFLGNHLLFSTS